MKETTLNANGRLPVWRRVCYGFTDAGGNFTFSIISSYLMVFYTDVVGLTPLVISTIMLVARIWDAINDPMMGVIADKTKSRWGRYRPYLLFAAPILGVMTVLTFCTPHLFGFSQILYCALTYILCGMAYTATSVAGVSLANVLSPNNQERITLISFRGAISNVASLITSAAMMPIILHFGGGDASSADGYFYAALIFSIAGTICYWIAFAGTKEVINPVAEGKKVSVKESLMTAFQDKNVRSLLVGYLIYMCGVFGRVGIMVYFFLYVVEQPTWMATASVVMTIAMMAPNFITPFLTKRFEKRNLIAAFLVLGFIGGVIMFLGGNMSSLPVICFGTALFHGCGAGVGGFAYGLIAEIIDDMEVRTGNRADAIVSSVTSFAVKLGNAIAGSAGIAVLVAVGYVANEVQSAATKTSMNAVINIVPGVLYLIAIIPFALIKMNNKKAAENTKILQERRVAGNDTGGITC